MAGGAGGCSNVCFEAGNERGGTQVELAQTCMASTTRGGFDRWADAPEEGRSGACYSTPGESDPERTTDWQLAKVRKGKCRQPKGVSKSVQQRAEERREVEVLWGRICEIRLLSLGAQALLIAEDKITELQARIQELQAGLRQHCL